jgi:RES domain-containing protein
LILYRVSNFADLAGKGGELAEGRWHTRQHGRRIVYLSDHPALCLLETIVHVEREEELPDTYQLISVDVPNDFIESVDPSLLPENWNSDLRVTQQIGNQWLSRRQKGGLLVPSAIVPVAQNCLLNPLLPEIASLMPKVVGRFPFDTRLFQRRA